MRNFCASLLVLLAACSNSASVSNGDGRSGTDNCSFFVSNDPQSLSSAEVEQVIAQGVQAAHVLGSAATFSVVDRSGNVLAVYKMNGAADTISIGTLTGRPAQGLEGLNGIIPAELAAIAKAITGAYLSSSGNAFSSRTASYIVQNHFAPGISNTPGGPLFGVQFSQLPCGDLVGRGLIDTAAPKRSPLGLSADPGGFPLYKNGRVVGGIGVIADGNYGSDLDPSAGRASLDERIAQSALTGFGAPICIRAERITAGGLALPYSNSDSALVKVNVTSLNDPQIVALGDLVSVPTYYDNASIGSGVAFGTTASGIAADSTDFAAESGYILVDPNNATNRYPPISSPLNGVELTAAEVKLLLLKALGVANQARAQIRFPQGSSAQVTISIVDTAGNILGIVRTPDAPIFGIDVALQKARTALFFSSPQAAALLAAQPAIAYLGGAGFPTGTPFTLDAVYLSGQTSAAKIFFNNSAIFSNGVAFSARSIGNISRPNFPDGIDANSNGPFSKSLTSWSIFNDGLQLDLVYNGLIQGIVDPANTNNNCTGTGVVGNTGIVALKNGIQIFPGGFPIYRDNVLIGGIGVSGDGVDQDDMVGLLGLARAGQALQTGVHNAPSSIRADTLLPLGRRLRYAQCPQAPFNNSIEENVCDGI